MNKGTICVERGVHADGKVQILAIDPQWHYKEWSGCFSLITETLSEQEERDRLDIDRWLAEQDVNYE